MSHKARSNGRAPGRRDVRDGTRKFQTQDVIRVVVSTRSTGQGGLSPSGWTLLDVLLLRQTSVHPRSTRSKR